MRAIGEALRDMPRRLRGAFRDPLRRRNLAGRVFEALVGGGAAIGGAWVWGWPAGLLLAPLAEFVVYEFLLEPLGWAGHYFERGPREGEAFTEW